MIIRGKAVKTKRDSSMRVAFEMVHRGEASALVSAGNSGAMLAGGLLILRRLKGLDRPGHCGDALPMLC